MKKLFRGIFVAIVVDAFIFPVSLNILPGINTKMMLAALGLAVFLFRSFARHEYALSRRTVISALLAVLFSVWCLFSITENNTDEKVYVTYWSSFLTWLCSAYGVFSLVKACYGKCDLALLTKYLAIVSVSQCAIALMIDNIPAVKSAVQSVFFQGYNFFERVDRLYGIGCALDPAGVRFAAILLLVTHQLVANRDVYESKAGIAWYLTAFILITILGSMIARTTSVGAALALVYLLISYFTIKKGGEIDRRQILMFFILLLLLASTVLVATVLYNSSPEARENLRFAFEGFFNWVETGQFRTTSTDILMNVMWVWPDNFHDWVIGTGTYGVYVWNTDIGYCNFTLYCGLTGLSIFCIFFIYTSLSLNSKFNRFFLLSLLLIVLQGIIWAKVATDIYCVLALLQVIDGNDDEVDEADEADEELEETETGQIEESFES